MSERFKEHAWKSTPPARADAHQIPPTHSRPTTSPNIDTRRRVLVNHRIDRGFAGACDTVLTQSGRAVARNHIEWYLQGSCRRLKDTGAPKVWIISERPLFAAAYTQMHDAIRSLVKRAVKSGDIREHLDPIDLLRALVGVANIARPAPTGSRARGGS